ncbi:MAG: extracellular solute-binding protein [Eubacteriales bacterium]
MKKKMVSMLLVMTVCVSLITGCGGNTTTEQGSGDSNSAESTTVVSTKKEDLLLWLPPNSTDDSMDGVFWQEALAPWAEENNVNLTIEITPWGGYEEKYLTGFASGSGPDVGLMYLEMISDFIDMGALADMSGYFEQEEIDNYLYFDSGYVRNGQYGVPVIVGNARIPLFNMDLLEQAGVTELPTTWDEVTETALKVKDANLDNVIPFALAWGGTSIGTLNSSFYPFMWQASGEIYDEAGENVALMDTDGAVRAAQFLYDLRFTHEVMPDECLTLTDNSVLDEFVAGRVAIMMGATANSEMLDNAGLNWDFVPYFVEDQAAVWVASDMLIMNDACENKELAASLVKEITSATVMEAYHTEILPFPPISKDETFLIDEKFKDLYENQTEHFKTLPVATGSFKVMDALYKNLQLLMMGQLTPEEAIQLTVEYANNL